MRHRHLLKCFQQNTAWSFLARIVEIALGVPRGEDIPPSLQAAHGLLLAREAIRPWPERVQSASAYSVLTACPGFTALRT